MRSISEIGRRIYRELVRRRSTVRVVTAAEPELKEDPIFLIGVYRSGTTLLRYIVDSHSRICCPPETKFLGAMEQLIDVEDNRVGFAGLGCDADHVVRQLRQFAAYFFENYARSRGKPRWADKSPPYTGHLDFIVRLFPSARFVMIHRHPLDVAHSMTRGGTHRPGYLGGYLRSDVDPRVCAGHYWRDHTAKMLAFEAARPEACFRLRYESLCESPQAALKPMFDFLGETWEPAVLEYHRFEHDVGNEDGRTGATREISINQGNYQVWPREMIQRVAEVVAPVMEKLEYRLEPSRSAAS
jgi:hypothetical protein